MSEKTSSKNDPAQNFEPSDALVDSVQAKMDTIADLKDDTVPDPTPETPAEPEATVPPVEEPTESSDPNEAETPTESTLPDAYRRAAVHNKWTTEEIDKFFARDPEMAMKTFESIHKSTNAQSEGWAKLGEAKRDAETTAPAPVSTDVPKTDIDFSALEEDDPDSPALAIVKKLAAEITELKARPATVQVAQPSANDRDSTQRDIDQFFADKSLMSDPKYYGTGLAEGDLTPNQQANRMKVFITADRLIAGTAAQGDDMNNLEALGRAHLLEAAPSLKAETVADIKNTLTNREQNIDFKPTAGQPPAKPTEKESEATLVGKTKGLLDKIFKNN